MYCIIKHVDKIHIYSCQALLYGHLLDTVTSLLLTICFVPGERKPLRFL